MRTHLPHRRSRLILPLPFLAETQYLPSRPIKGPLTEWQSGAGKDVTYIFVKLSLSSE